MVVRGAVIANRRESTAFLLPGLRGRERRATRYSASELVTTEVLCELLMHTTHT